MAIADELVALREENKMLRDLIGKYFEEFRMCRFCAHMKEDCSPTDGSCEPKWGGL